VSWWRKNWRWLLTLAVTAGGAFAVLQLYIYRKNAEASKLRAELALLRAGAKVQGLRADRTARKAELAHNTSERKAIEQELAVARRRAVATVKAVDGMSSDDIANEFRALGY